MAERRPVRVLPETVANQIAAGEVVERPASVVKELVENALDAGATRVDVVVEGGGAKLVEVADNGSGMDREDALAALERQATSKISTSEDITHIGTFGFRGEAIPSIASVSRFSIVTRIEGADAATSIQVIGGTRDWVGEAGRPIGTTVTVRDLFFNVPARRKFLRAPTTELTRIRQTLSAIALANPAVAFRLRADGRDLFRLPEGDALADRVRVILGEAVADVLLPIDHEQGGIAVSGFISKPDFVRGGTPEQYCFVNRRPATAVQVQVAVRDAWPVRDHRPVVVLFVDLPPEEVDVNVHPAKREVRFRRGDLVSAAIRVALAKALGATLPEPTPLGAQVPTLSPIGPLPTPQAPKPRQADLPLEGIVRGPYPSGAPTPPPPPTLEGLPQDTPLRPPKLADYPILRDPPPSVAPIQSPPPPPPETAPATTLPWKWLRVADVLEQGYWLVVTDQGYVVVDAKAALECLFYDRFSPAAGETIASQPLLIPETLHLPAADAERVARFLPELGACGFGVSALGQDTFLIDALPVAFAELPPKEILADIATELDQPGLRKGLDAWRREVVARAAAQAAARAFRVTSTQAAEPLLAELARSAMPYATPRGRPTMILTTYRELDRRFRRT